ncbi:MAG: CoA ester lyase [Dehalococcoidia bacterium]|nr:CoA ester lyase [Dehalococcoidia bacterium]
MSTPARAKSKQHPNPARPIRSLASAPGTDERLMRDAIAWGADALLVDICDAVAPSRRLEARATAIAAFKKLGKRIPIFVKLNHMDEPSFEEEIHALACPELHCMMLPHITGPEEVRQFASLLDQVERKKGMPLGYTRIYPIVELAQAARNAYEMATATPRVAYMGGGTSRGGDITMSLGFSWTADGLETLYLRSKVLLDVRAAGVEYPITGFTPIEVTALTRFCEQSKQLGYAGTMVHARPEAIKIVNEIFSPTLDEISRFTRILAEHDRLGKAAPELVDDGQGHRILAAYARKRLSLARRLGLTP